MNPHELEEVMLTFMRGDADILVSTTIIESGIDIATANTMFINDADRFGLADLHQLRGRVGRYKHRAYCYMLLPPERNVTEVAQKRLKAIEQYSMLGAGFKIAMRDLEIRGAGNLLGAEQSGHIAAVGYEMYCRLLDEAVRDLKHEKPPATAAHTAIDVGVTGTIPKPYIPSDQRRLEAYRRIATAATEEELHRVSTDLHQAYGEPPRPVQRLLDLAEVRLLAAQVGVRTITVRGQDLLLRTENPAATAEQLRRAIESNPTIPAGARLPSTRRGPVERVRRPAPAIAGDGPAHRLEGDAAVRVLPPPSGERLAEVYFRPPPDSFEPETLLAILRQRLRPAEGAPARDANAAESAASGAPQRPAHRTLT
jgi:transcription-repair coupling factor (superfamily II helicase)